MSHTFEHRDELRQIGYYQAFATNGIGSMPTHEQSLLHGKGVVTHMPAFRVSLRFGHGMIEER